MELRQLEYFLAVAEEANFTRAAARVHVAQPGVSAQIRRLERELGQSLLDRSNRTVRLTVAGTAVMPYARAALAAVEGVKSAVDELSGLVRGHVSVGMVTLCAPIDIPSLLADFHGRYPDIEITLLEANSDVLVNTMQTGELDIAFIGIAGDPPAGIATQAVTDDAVVTVVAAQDQFAGRDVVPLAELCDRPLICLPHGTGTRAAFERGCTSIGIKARIAFEASDPRVLAQLAGRGFGVAVLPESIARITACEFPTMAISEPSLRARIELAWRDNGPISPAGHAMVRYARAAVTKATTAR